MWTDSPHANTGQSMVMVKTLRNFTGEDEDVREAPLNLSPANEYWQSSPQVTQNCDGGPRSAAQLVLVAFRIGSKKRALRCSTCVRM
jgi:hypothetical protein